MIDPKYKPVIDFLRSKKYPFLLTRAGAIRAIKDSFVFCPITAMAFDAAGVRARFDMSEYIQAAAIVKLKNARYIVATADNETDSSFFEEELRQAMLDALK